MVDTWRGYGRTRELFVNVFRTDNFEVGAGNEENVHLFAINVRVIRARGGFFFCFLKIPETIASTGNDYKSVRLPISSPRPFVSHISLGRDRITVRIDRG